MNGTAQDLSLSFRVLKQQVSIARVLAAYDLHSSLRQRGPYLQGPCPLHGGDNPTAFRVHLQRNLWHCFTACGGGDVVDLVRRIEQCDHAAAARHLRRLAQGPAPTPARRPSSPPTVTSPKRSRPRVFRPFSRRIPLDPRVPFLQQRKGIGVSTAMRFEAGCTDRSGFLRGTVAVRLHDLEGRPLGYCGRNLAPDQIERFGKWRFPPGFPKGQTLYNAHRALPAAASGLVLLECPWAAMRLVQAGVSGAGALLGTSLSQVQAEWLSAAPRVLLLLDGDAAGRKAARTISNRLNGRSTIKVHELPEGHEPEDLPDPELAAVVGKHLSLSF
ncbi:MAG: toprim domain-containing protein [Oligoflexia bacterium]|nr:toprim domain-containing protein [Oligoflexia bacterium]